MNVFNSLTRSRWGKFLPFLRRTGLAPFAEFVLRRQIVAQAGRANADWIAKNPGLALPPVELLFETQGYGELAKYLESGKAAAQDLWSRVISVRPEAQLTPLRVLDWGCGVVRLARHWRDIAPHWEVHCCDPNPKIGQWVQAHFPWLHFVPSKIQPPLPFESERFDLIYGLSILTHVPIHQQFAWIRELTRILRPNGLLALTLHSRTDHPALTPSERGKLALHGMVERAGASSGSRLFATYHHPEFVQKELSHGLTIMRYETLSAVASGGQDLWLLQKQQPVL